ncbi:MAG TPA: hypothetical protein VMX57_01125, partial [Planctomycetota bacterium]|nr:hypothetical protein [Planctomycetota bacterium]
NTIQDWEKQKVNMELRQRNLPGEISKLEQDLPNLQNKRDEARGIWEVQKKKFEEVTARAKQAEEACKDVVLEVVDAWDVPVLLAPLEIVRAKPPKKN